VLNEPASNVKAPLFTVITHINRKLQLYMYRTYVGYVIYAARSYLNRARH
jgi:hypothetical protein